MTRTITTWLALLTFCSMVAADDWPQYRGPLRDGVWRETGIMEKLPEKLTRMWEVPIGAGYAGPAVDANRVYVMDRNLDAGQSNPDNPFAKDPVGGSERLLCLDAATGKELWKYEYPCRYTISYPAGPRATPTVIAGKVFGLGAMGDFFCLDSASGRLIWAKNLPKEFGAEVNTWGYSASPLVDGDQVITLVGGKNGSGVVSFDAVTGKEKWRSLDLPDPGYCPPEIIMAGGTRQLIVWSPKALHSLDPATGKVYWEQPFQVNFSLSIPSPVKFDNLLFITSFYNGPLMMKLAEEKPTASLLWKGTSNSEKKTDGLHAIMCTPTIRDGYIYGVCSYGQLRCLEAETGKRIWETTEATGSGRWWNAFIVKRGEVGDRYVLCNEQGDLIFARLTPKGYTEESRAFLIEPTGKAERRKIVWSHPAFANRSVFARNDKEIIRVDLSEHSRASR